MKEQKFTLFLDMDGVLADFFSHVMNHSGLDLREYEAEKPWSYDVGKWMQEMQPTRFPAEPAWSSSWFEDVVARMAVYHDFWAAMPKYPWTKRLLKEIEGMGITPHILTRPMNHPECYSQKIKWIREHVGDVPVTITKHKHLLARANHILIDDHQETIDQFSEAGGRGILFPQHWNILFPIVNDTEMVFEYLLKTLNVHIGQINWEYQHAK